MGFMDGVTNFTKGVGAKAKGNYDVVNLNAQISMLSKEITGIYTSIGERYYTLHKESPEACFEGMIKEINDRVAAINRMQREIENTKESLASVQLINTQPQVARYCVSCGSPMDADNIFCVKCGTKQPEHTTAETLRTEPVAMPSEEVSEQIDTPSTGPDDTAEPARCPDCGTVIKDDAAFCTSCGRKL